MSRQMEISVLPHFAFASQLSLGIVFLLSALPKLRRPLAFVQSVVEYKVLPAKVAYVFALALIPLEAFLAIAFLTGWWADAALPLATVMLIVFLMAVGTNLRRGRKIDCGCFGNTSEQISPRTMARLLLLLTTVLLLVVFKGTGGASLPSRGAMTADVSTFIYLLQTAFLAAFLILLAAWMLSLPEVVPLVRRWRWSQSSSGNTKTGDGVEGA
ncbi:MAG TPA: MauE/DoxX family redox-associated membrane protein [Anaerolineae bacterium]|nr:MauE/DoxX family redox-associated membrane protein [Anaerolineae bacterium]